MQKQLTHIFRQGAAAVMLLLFVGYYADVNFFAHAHIINGVTIVHSHVHSEHHHDSAAGGHSTSEITLIAQMASQFLTTGETGACELQTYNILLETIGIEQDAKATPHHFTCLSLRAPPAFFLKEGVLKVPEVLKVSMVAPSRSPLEGESVNKVLKVPKF